MDNFQKHILNINSTANKALEKLNLLGSDAILILTNDDDKFFGSITDGDIRRGLLKGLNINQNVNDFVQPNKFYIKKESPNIYKIKKFREKNIKVVPVLDIYEKVVEIINLKNTISYLPVDVLIMAGGKGERLKPLTDTIPKPLLKVGEKSIIEHNIERLIKFGIKKIHISVNYLADKIIEKLGNGEKSKIQINYIKESEPLGTIGSLSLLDDIKNEYILVSNSDILTNLDYEDFYLNCIENQAEISVATIPYEVKIPYAVLDTNENNIISLKEKPAYTYYSNAGIYLVRKTSLSILPKNIFYNATDFIESLINKNFKVISYPLRNYWKEIGIKEDYFRVQEDIKHLKF